MKEISIIICTEKGKLEKKSMLLVESFRKYGGPLRKAPIYSYQPRKGREVGTQTKRFFKRNNVSLIGLPLNTDYHNYPLANKIYASSHAEKTLNSDILVFVDSDMFFLNEPSEFLIPNGYDATLRPVDWKIIGAENEKDPNWAYWKKLYNLLEVKEYSFVTTSIDRKKILPYWNTGHIAVRREKSIFQNWEKNFHKAMKHGLTPFSGLFFVEQSVLAATISALRCRVKTFSSFYNYPIHLQKIIPVPCQKAFSLDKIVSAHYHRIFEDGSAEDILKPMMDVKNPKSRWLASKLKSFNFYQ